MEQLEIYHLSMTVSQEVWEQINSWDKFSKETLGKQLIRSIDSISANIAEGCGRYSYRDRILFFLYARGSLLETKCWIDKARSRELIDQACSIKIKQELDTLHIKLNYYIKSLRNHPKITRSNE